ncbi:cytochrome C assembly protein [SAR202 cluster bacterium AD-802-E10_MRT_200m]|nr:cytochrome C assembly protein [SAR202 cluster bacterium AD-802-E10_MRT_200m]
MLTKNVTLGVLGLSWVSMLVLLYLVFVWVPTESNLGLSQRIFYLHVPVAWVGFLAFGLVFISSVAYLVRGNDGWDNLAYAAAEVGVVFTTLILLTGILWAKPVWGIWWSWSPRLTTSLILWLIYVAYLMLRSYSSGNSQGPRYAAVLGIIGFIDVPIVYFSIQWWRDIHPERIVGVEQALESSMYLTLLAGVVAFTCLFFYLVLARIQVRSDEQAFEKLRRQYD